MGMLSYSRIRERTRLALRDVHALLLDDAVLDDIINEGQREYALASGSLTGEMEVIDPGTGVWACPSDWIKAERFIGIDGLEVPFYSWRVLHDRYGDFRTIEGDHVRCIVADFDGFGKLRMFPKSRREGVTAGRVYYKRLPKADRLEAENEEAVEQYVLYAASLLTGKGSAGRYYQNFLDIVNSEGKQYRGISSSRRIRRGRFF